MLIYKCHYKVIHRVWRTSTVSWGLLPSRPLSSPPCPSPLYTLLSPHSAHCISSLTKAHQKKQSKKILHPGSQALGRCLRSLSRYGPRSPLQGAGTTRPVSRYRSATRSWVGGWPHNPVRPVQPCSGMEMGGSSMADALSQTPAAVGCRTGWDNFPNKTKKTKKSQNNESKSVSAPSRAGPALSTNTSGGQWQGPTAAAAGKVACPFSQQHGITNNPLHRSAKPLHSRETTITGGLELSPKMSSRGLPPPSSPPSRVAGITGTSNPSHPPAASLQQGRQICQHLSSPGNQVPVA